jgi:adenosylcobinamide kinase/adenosylcobinamide-phosphate guanylyltransferase
MSGLVLLLGGARSGKSSLALRLAAASGRPVVFVATGSARDDEMAARIARHRAERPPAWRTLEEPLDLAGALATADAEACAVVDCLSLWVHNLLEQGGDDAGVERCAAHAAALAAARPAPTIAVTNEVGQGVVPASALGRRYRDLLGRVNACWAAAARSAALVVAGRVLPLSPADRLIEELSG